MNVCETAERMASWNSVKGSTACRLNVEAQMVQVEPAW